MIPTGQEDPGNLPQIQAYACDLFSHWWHVERTNGNQYFATPDIINQEYQSLLANNLKELDSDCTIEDGENLFLAYLIGAKQMIDPINGTTFISPNYIPKPGQLCIKCFHWDEKKFVHFCGWDQETQTLYDPIARGSNTVKYGYFHSWRIYDLT